MKAANLIDTIRDARDRIRGFERQSAAQDYTDTAMAWEVLMDAESALSDALAALEGQGR